MPRIRTVKPDFWKSEKVAQRLPGPDGRQARLFFVALWNFAEDHGVIRGNPRYLLSEIFAYEDDLNTQDIERWLALLERGEFIIRFSRDGLPFVWIRNFNKHQRIDHPSAATLPKPSASDMRKREEVGGVTREDSENPREGSRDSREGSTNPRPDPETPRASPRGGLPLGREGIGSEGSGTPRESSSTAEVDGPPPPVPLPSTLKDLSPRQIFRTLSQQRSSLLKTLHGHVLADPEQSNARLDALISGLKNEAGKPFRAEYVFAAHAKWTQSERALAQHPPAPTWMFLQDAPKLISQEMSA